MPGDDLRRLGRPVRSPQPKHDGHDDVHELGRGRRRPARPKPRRRAWTSHRAPSNRLCDPPSRVSSDRSALRTPAVDLLGIDLPIVQAPVGRATTPALAATVSNAGALGTLALSWTDLAAIRDQVDRTRRLTARPYAVNFVLAWDQRPRLEACLELGVRVVSTFWGRPHLLRAGRSRFGRHPRARGRSGLTGWRFESSSAHCERAPRTRGFLCSGRVETRRFYPATTLASLSKAAFHPASAWPRPAG
jgi:hypothetical protein